MSYSGHTWTVDGLDPVLLCAVVGEGLEVHGLEVALGALVLDFPVDGVDVVVDRPTELRLEVTKAEIRDKRRVTGKSIHFERHMTAPEIWLLLTVGFDPKGYFPCGANLFKLAIWL